MDHAAPASAVRARLTTAQLSHSLAPFLRGEDGVRGCLRKQGEAKDNDLKPPAMLPPDLVDLIPRRYHGVLGQPDVAAQPGGCRIFVDPFVSPRACEALPCGPERAGPPADVETAGAIAGSLGRGVASCAG